MVKTIVITGVALSISLCQVATATTWFVDGSVSASGDGTSWETAFQKIQEGIGVASHGDIVIVRPGTYLENINFDGKNITLRSTDPLDPEVVASTIIDGNQAGSVVTFSGYEDGRCVLSGFTIRNGRYWHGAGISGGTLYQQTYATIENNVVTENSSLSDESWSSGGGLYGCDGIIRNNTISANRAGNHGGGGLARCDGTIEGNRILSNSSDAHGGGLRLCNALIQNNVISGNSAAIDGGGVFNCHGTVRNNTIVYNSAGGSGSGLAQCAGTIRNCIIWGNTAPEGAQLYASSDPINSCIENWSGDFEKQRNIPENPQFLNPEDGNFRLLPTSPCIDVGFNAPDLPLTDIAGMHRVMYGGNSLTVDIGAYEYYINQIEPDTEGQVNLTWSSLPAKTYAIYFSSDMTTWECAADGVPSAGDTITTWLTSTAPFLNPEVRRRYYKIEENE